MRNYAIEVKNLTKHYRVLKALDEISFKVLPGTCFGFLGPNGAGKTTLMKVLYGKSKRDSAGHDTVSVFGYDPVRDSLTIKFISGIVPQEDNLDVGLSVMENLLIYSKFYGMKKKDALPFIESALQFMELHDKKDSKIEELSGGMKRRLLIARALINKPKLLILDEPTTGLDPQVRHHIWDKLRSLKKEGVTILLTTHYMEEAYQICDELIIMNKGQAVVTGNPGELIRKYMETYVLEVLNMENDLTSVPDCIRKEISHNRVLLYSENFEEIRKVSDLFKTGEFILRQSNLEDLFMKITGSHLDE